MAEILLQICQKDFNAIGSLGFPSEEDDPTVMSRPLSMNLAQLANFTRVPLSFLPPATRTFSTSSEYYKVLADLHLSQLCFQRNQAIDSADDCRKKYVARQLFRKLAAENRLADSCFDSGPFKLWCDDFRPANVLVDKNDTVAAVIDWEFTYSAPADFSHSPPWWLLLKAPEDWEAGLDDWAANYEPRLDAFLRALEARERELIEKRLLTERGIISRRMRENWESGRFWVTYAAQRTWAFDGIFWKYLDERFFGPNETGGWKSRVKLLSKHQVDTMEELVKRKVREKDEGTLVDWDELDAMSCLPPDIQRAYLSI